MWCLHAGHALAAKYLRTWRVHACTLMFHPSTREGILCGTLPCAYQHTRRLTDCRRLQASSFIKSTSLMAHAGTAGRV